MVALKLEWVPHSGFDGGFDLPPQDQRPSATALPWLFQEYRKGAAGHFFPSYRSNPLLEVACFDPTTCACISYELGSESQITRISDSTSSSNLQASTELLFSDGILDSEDYQREYQRFPQCSSFPIGKHSCQRTRCLHLGRGENASEISMHGHRPREIVNSDSVCLATQYQRDIEICTLIHRGKLNPSHWWLHAMDPATYPCPSQVYSLPECWDVNCKNYRQMPGFSQIYNWRHQVHGSCLAGETTSCR